MRLFVLDAMRRQPWATVGFGPMLAAMWIAAGWFGDAETDLTPMAFAMSLGWVHMMGTPRIQFIPRAVWHLPISRRDIGRGRWLVATVFAVAITTGAKLAAMLFPSVQASFGLPGVLLSSVYDFAFAGIGYAVAIAASERPPEHGQWRAVRVLVRGTCEAIGPLLLSLPMLLATVSGGRLIRLWLPTHWSDLSPRGWTLLVIALAVAIATYFHTPGPPLFARQLSPGRHAPSPALVPLAQEALSGLPYLLARETVWTLTIGSALTAVALLFAHAFGMTVADGEVVLMYAFVLAGLSNRFPDLLPQLRVLPIGVRQLNALLLLWPAFVWTAGWLCCVVVPAMVMNHAAAFLRADVLVALVGLSALAQALIMRLSGVSRFMLLATTSGLVPLFPILSLALPSAAMAALVGLVCLTGAAVLNHVMLRHSSTYHARIGPMLLPAR